MSMEPPVFLALLLLLTTFVTMVTPTGCKKKYAKQVLLVSMDGFRYDYPEKVDTPNFDRMARYGTRAAYVNNSFTTKTFPSHYGIVTGLHEESHGIVGNRMYDPVFDEYFSMATKDTKWWNAKEPLWITARKQGLKSGCVFWPGSEVEIDGLRPNTWYAYNESITFDQRIDIVIDLLKKDKYNFVTTYFHEPDRDGHIYGPDSIEVENRISSMDTLLGTLLDKLTENKLWRSVNLFVVSDHGMTATDYDNKLIDIFSLVNSSMVNFTVDYGPIMHIVPVTGQEDTVVNLINSNPNVNAYKKADIPEVWHYKNNRRVMPVFVVANEGWTITTDPRTTRQYPLKGNHGYDNRLMTMKSIFYASGPNIRANYSASPLESIDVYPMICELLGLTPSPNNGTLANTADFLKTCSGTRNLTSNRPCVILACLIFLVNFLML